MNKEDLIEAIDKKIKYLEESEKPENLLRKALVKKEIISDENIIDDKKIQEIFDIIKNHLS